MGQLVLRLARLAVLVAAAGAWGSSIFNGSTGTPTGPAGGDLGGTFPNPTVTRVYGSPSSPLLTAPPVAASWTITDAGGSNTTIADLNSAVLISKANGNSVGEATLAAPGASGSAFTITAHFAHMCAANGTTLPSYSLIVGDAGDARFHSFEVVNNGGIAGPRVVNWMASNGSNAVPVAYEQGDPALGAWLRVQYTGTGGNFLFTFSPTGDTNSFKFLAASIVANSFLLGNPAKIGVAVYPQLSTVSCTVALDYWLVTQP